MATGATNTLTQDLRIELKFMTDGFKNQAKQAGDSLRQLNGKFNTTAKSASRTRKATSGFAESLKALVTIQAGRAMLQTALSFDRVNNRMKFATETVDELNESLSFTADVSNSIGLALVETQRGFATISASAKGTALAGESVKEIFNAVANASGALSLSADETNSVFLAFSQIISKGKVQAEELRGQIGERLPGAVNIASRALGVTNQELDKMLEKGEVLADDFLPKFARELNKTFGADAIANSDSLTANVNKFNNAIKIVTNTTAKWVLENSALVLSLKKVAEQIEATKIETESDQNFNSNIISTLKEQIAQNDILRKQNQISDAEFRRRSKVGADLLEKNFNKANATNEQLKEFFELSSFTIGSGSDRQNNVLIDITNEYLVKQREITRETEKQAKSSQALVNVLSKGFDIVSDIGKATTTAVKFINDPFQQIAKAQADAQLAFAQNQAERLKQGNLDVEKVKNLKKQEKVLKNQLATLKEQEKALQGGGQVNFVRSIQAGSEDANRRSIETRAKLAGGVRGNEELLRENNEGQDRIERVLEDIKEQLTVEKV